MRRVIRVLQMRITQLIVNKTLVGGVREARHAASESQNRQRQQRVHC